MIRLGFDLDQADHSGRTALIAACKDLRTGLCLQKLLENGASVNKADFEGRTPLIHAVLSN
jgi:ankyrin repeat protein